MLKENKIRLFIVDDHPIVTQGLCELIREEKDMEICGSAEEANSALSLIEKTNPNIAMVDISLKGSVNGLDLIKALRKRQPQLQILVLSMYDESLYAERAIRAGARGYIMKNEMTTAIVSAVRKVMNGEIYLNHRITSKILDRLLYETGRGIKKSIEKLTDRELDVLQLIGDGMKTSDIARRLCVSIKTVETHRLRIRTKLNIKNSVELVKFAVDWLNETRQS